ncbi:hypothetical protein [Rhizobium sp. P40RR-XXII]|uniref:hypothetical protein n=1 Tax=Rhizobium sp. P40RR-XXII TaxID=2726739 RepID=UPI001FEEC150|nr:hypothetical protein [Rhizobium sp. P40RR-XXII]
MPIAAPTMSSVAFWYQAGPHKPFGAFPDVTERMPTFRRPFTEMEIAVKKARG